MKRLSRFHGENITIDGIEGILVGPRKRDATRKYTFTSPYTGEESAYFHGGDHHYRFVWGEGEECFAMVVSARSLQPAPSDLPVSYRTGGEPRGYRRFLFRHPGFGIVGTVAKYTAEDEASDQP